MEQDNTHHEAKMASTATSASSDGAETVADTDMEVDVEEADMTRWTETEFEEKCTYIVKDTPWEAGPDSDIMTTTTTRAEASLPRNLAFKHPADSKEVRLQHTHTHKHTHTHTHTHTLADMQTFSPD